MGDQSLESTQRSMKYLLALLAPALVAAEADTGYGYAPQVYCRDTNTSVYAQVCVPAFTTKVTPITLDVKRVVDNDYCYNQIRTVCEETNKVVPRKICTYKYNSVKETLSATTTQVTYETKTETMKVTTCKASGYGSAHYGGGEHQYCHEEYQTQSFKVPLVTWPLPSPSRCALTRRSPSPRSCARTSRRRSASTWPSSRTTPPPSSRPRSSWESQTATTSPSPSPPRLAQRRGTTKPYPISILKN